MSWLACTDPGCGRLVRHAPADGEAAAPPCPECSAVMRVAGHEQIEAATEPAREVLRRKKLPPHLRRLFEVGGRRG